MAEFDLIRRHFTRATRHTVLGVGDDAALIQPGAGMELAISADMLVSGIHFFADADPYQLGWKSLAVNISDMAAMGAQPKWATLAIGLPAENNEWLSAFSVGLFACADTFKVDLIGGDTTRSPHGLTISIQIMGEVPAGKALRRSGAQVGDDVWVSGRLGLAAAALDQLFGKQAIPKDALAAHLHALHMPLPRVDLGLALRDIASSCLDISDGLLADLGHILDASQVGATLQLNALPTSNFIAEHLDDPLFQRYVLAGGDDYELCFTASPQRETALLGYASTLQIPLSKVGKITPELDLKVLDAQRQPIHITHTGYNHFDAP